MPTTFNPPEKWAKTNEFLERSERVLQEWERVKEEVNVRLVQRG